MSPGEVDQLDQMVRWGPRPYPQLLRGPRHRWWRPLVGAAVAAGGLAVLVLLAVVAYAVAQAVLGRPVTDAEALASPVAFLGNNLLLAALVPLSWAALRVGHGVAPRWQASVVGRTRWRWMLVSGLLPTAVVLVSVLGLGLLALASGEEPFGSGDARSGATTAALLVVVLLTTPLQAAGEEHLFRGWMSQAVGSWFRRPVLGAVVAALVSAAAFAFAHGDQDPWLYADRFLFGLTASYLAWRTGGLETGISFHAVNNVVIFVPTVLAGGLGESLETTSASPALVLLDGVGFAVIAVGTAWLARRRGLVRLSVPPRVESSLGAVTRDGLQAGSRGGASASVAEGENPR
ncbi:CPBP family intramembrane metalloprotease [Streptomyces sp. NP160]|uniref:CPBP family intramembrane glutamic endopeptidase n=1 Tax=Streptomyces sp. NP160 TaxID=2586637 RepID=UPI00111966F6|nr:CPBP family intramembrane glutamic endopeptidase [Streptomyces sp. NP160]TNM68442.1 CPBP family intramembrane metalloprotease [Streptomyces sp. NP160]